MKTAAKPASRKALNVSMDEGPEGLPVVTLTLGYSVTAYTLREIKTDWMGRAFTLTKNFGFDGTDQTEETYSVFIAGKMGAWDECGCRGFAAHRHCKHVDAIKGLIRENRLPICGKAK